MKASICLQEFMQAFPTEDSCIEYFEEIRWHGNVKSPFDPTSKVYKCSNNRYRCKNTGKYFTWKTNTMFAASKVSLRKWLYAIYIFTSHKRGISSCQMAKDIGVTQKTAWRMLNTLRECMPKADISQILSEIEIDETFVGGKNKNRHKDKKVKKCQGRSFKDKVPVFGMLQRGGVLVATTVPNTRSRTLVPIIKRTIGKGSTIYTDGWIYKGINKDYHQLSVDHKKHLYGITIEDDDNNKTVISTNGIENAWSHLKRMIFGVYYKVSKKKLQLYVNEFVFRFNTRICCDYDRFALYLHLNRCA